MAVAVCRQVPDGVVDALNERVVLSACVMVMLTVLLTLVLVLIDALAPGGSEKVKGLLLVLAVTDTVAAADDEVLRIVVLNVGKTDGVGDGDTLALMVRPAIELTDTDGLVTARPL